MQKFDERQLKIRGDVFKHAFILLLALTLGNSLAHSLGFNWAEPVWTGILTAVVCIAVCSVELILRGAYLVEHTSQRAVPYLLGLSGLFLLIMSSIHFATGAVVFNGGGLSEESVHFIMALCFLSIGLSYIVKERRDKREEAE